MKRLLVFLLAMCVIMSFAGCTDETKDGTTEEMLLFDYYSSAAADDGGHYEITLTSGNKDGYLYLDEYIKASAEDDETSTRYTVSYDAYKECMLIAEKYSMQEWNDDPEMISTDGSKLVCKFYDGSEYIRVSNEAMPENGEAIFEEIKNTLIAYIK